MGKIIDRVRERHEIAVIKTRIRETREAEANFRVWLAEAEAKQREQQKRTEAALTEATRLNNEIKVIEAPRQPCGKSWIWKWLRLRDDLKGG